jgi:RNA-directed DNA polymerase
MARYGLTLHPEKTRLITFKPPQGGSGKGTATFDFLGFTLFWRKTQKGTWTVAFKTRRASLRRAIKAAAVWCRGHRHLAVRDQHVTLRRKLQGHFNYFGVNGNIRCLQQLVRQVERTWMKWLERRSQRGRMSWGKYKKLLQAFPLPRPRVMVQIWGRS